jgi:hypothetical protein
MQPRAFRRHPPKSRSAIVEAGTNSQAPSVLVIGDTSQPPFAQTCDVLASAGSVWQVIPDVSAIHASSTASLWPELILLLQKLPGEFTPSQIESLNTRWPLARVILVAGSWCEGEQRSYPALPVADRWYAHQAPLRLAAELRRRRAGRPPSWSLPITTTSEERTLWHTQSHPIHHRMERPLSVVVVARDPATLENLSDLCQSLGCRVTAILVHELSSPDQSTAPPYDLLLCDLPDGESPAPQLWERMPTARHRCCLVGFPRAAHHDWARAQQITLLSKPFTMAELREVLDSAGNTSS